MRKDDRFFQNKRDCHTRFGQFHIESVVALFVLYNVFSVLSRINSHQQFCHGSAQSHVNQFVDVGLHEGARYVHCHYLSFFFRVNK